MRSDQAARLAREQGNGESAAEQPVTPEQSRGCIASGAALRHATRRMLQALDGYWAHCEGGNGQRHHNCRPNLAEDWWTRFERYRREVEKCL